MDHIKAETGLTVGAVFDTPFEKGCKITDLSDMPFSFLALDSDGVECSFGLAMVTPGSVREELPAVDPSVRAAVGQRQSDMALGIDRTTAEASHDWHGANAYDCSCPGASEREAGE